jgi:hypothetical protein
MGSGPRKFEKACSGCGFCQFSGSRSRKPALHVARPLGLRRGRRKRLGGAALPLRRQALRRRLLGGEALPSRRFRFLFRRSRWEQGIGNSRGASLGVRCVRCLRFGRRGKRRLRTRLLRRRARRNRQRQRQREDGEDRFERAVHSLRKRGSGRAVGDKGLSISALPKSALWERLTRLTASRRRLCTHNAPPAGQAARTIPPTPSACR